MREYLKVENQADTGAGETGHTGTGDSPCKIRCGLFEAMDGAGEKQDIPQCMEETEQDDCVSVQDFPFDARVEAVVFDMFFRLCELTGASLGKCQAAISLLDNMCLWQARSGNQ